MSARRGTRENNVLQRTRVKTEFGKPRELSWTEWSPVVEGVGERWLQQGKPRARVCASVLENGDC